jgi:TATA-binding protein-associated factor
MGLGKSLQSICIIGSKHFERAAKHTSTGGVDSAHLPSLIICPPTLTGHWYHEIPKFTDYLRPVQYVGNGFERTALRPHLSKYDVVIASYETVRADIEELSKVDWLYCVLDEGHIIKNAKTKLAAAVKQIRAQHRLLLSGTPIQNNVLELWSLFDFLMPGFLGNERVFNDRFSKPILADRDGKATPKEREIGECLNYPAKNPVQPAEISIASAALEALHKQVLPFLLRRLKEDVLSDLPPKIIQDYYCELSPVQKHLYDEFSRSRAAEEAGEAVADGAPGQGHVFQSLQYLRKLCNHPGEKAELEDIRKRTGVANIHDVSNAPKLEALRWVRR